MADNSLDEMIDRKEPIPDQNENSSSAADDEEEEEEADVNEVNEEEFAMLDNQLNQLSSALDRLEHCNDSIHAQLLDLLDSNRQARQMFQDLQKENPQLQEDEASK